MKRGISILVISILILLTGCRPGKNPQETGNVEDQLTVPADGTLRISSENEQESIDVAELLNQLSPVKFIGSIVRTHVGVEEYRNRYASNGENFYVLNDCVLENGTGKCYLNRYNGASQSAECVTMKRQKRLVNGGRIVGFQAAGSDLVVFIQENDKRTKELIGYYAAFVNERGGWVEEIDLLPALKDCNLILEQGQDYEGVVWNPEGYFYLLNPEETKRYLLDGDGRFLEELTDLQDPRLSFYREKKAAEKEAQENHCLGILKNTPGEVTVFRKQGDKISASVYSNQKNTEKTELNLYVAGVLDYHTKNCLKKFESRRSRLKINITEKKGVWTENNWKQLTSELAAGEGPDMFLLPREQMLLLKEEGFLADLTGILSEEVEDQIFPAVLNNGKAGDGLYAMNYMAGVSTLMVSDRVWDKDTWSISDLLSLIEEREKKGSPLASIRSTAYVGREETPEEILAFFLADIGNSAFLDMEEKACHFDSEEFVRLLEVCRTYGTGGDEAVDDSQRNTFDAARSYVMEGKALAYQVFPNTTIVAYSEDMAAFQDTFHCVGYPTEGSSGNFWRFYDGLSVNANSEHMDIIEDLIRFFFSIECQMNENLGQFVIIRRDLLLGHVREPVSETANPVLDGGGWWIELQKSKDGDSYLKEYLAFLDSCLPEPTGIAEIRDIICREAAGFFYGERDANTVANTIQRKVKNYLGEKQGGDRDP